jgi:hypothetical protein
MNPPNPKFQSITNFFGWGIRSATISYGDEGDRSSKERRPGNQLRCCRLLPNKRSKGAKGEGRSEIPSMLTEARHVHGARLLDPPFSADRMGYACQGEAKAQKADAGAGDLSWVFASYARG